MLKKYVQCAFVFLLSVTALTACQPPATTQQPAAPQVSTKVKAHASSYIYLATIPKEQRTVYIITKNDSGTDGLDIKTWIAKGLQQKSFVVVDNIDKANVAIRINTFRLGKIQSDMAAPLLDSEFGNSTSFLSMTPAPDAKQPLPNNTALVLDIQYFERKKLIDPAQVTGRQSMSDLSDIQFLLLCNTTRWERFQTRVVSIAFDNDAPTEQVFNTLGSSAATANADSVRGLSN